MIINVKLNFAKLFIVHVFIHSSGKITFKENAIKPINLQ